MMPYLEQYTIAWIIYLISAIGLYGVFCHVIRKMRSHDLNLIFRLIIAAFLFTPAFNTFDDQYIAPAIVMGAFELLSDGLIAGFKNLVPIFLVIFVGMLALTARQFLSNDD